MANCQLEKDLLALITDDQIYSKGLTESISIIAEHCTHALAANNVSVWLLNSDEQLICNTNYSNADNQHDENNLIDAESSRLFMHYIATDRVKCINDVSADATAKTFHAKVPHFHSITSAVYATLRESGKVIGFVCGEMRGAKRDWTKEESFFIGSISDLISQRLLVHDALRTEAKHKSLYEHTSDGIILFSDLLFVDVNPATCKMYGASKEELLGKNPMDFSPEFQPCGNPSGPMAMERIQACLAGETQNFEWVHTKLDGTEWYADITLNAIKLHGEETLFGLMRDITEKKNIELNAQQVQNEIAYRAAHDSLTGLQNREQLHICFNNFIANKAPKDSPHKIAFMLFDLNRFKEINDTLGHATGDKALVQLAKLLLEPVEAEGGQLFRLGGDEFVAVFDSNSCKVLFEDLVCLLDESVRTTIVLDEISVELAASIGIAVYPDHGTDSHELLRCADVAMYHAKNNNEVFSLYDSANDLHNKRRLAMMVELSAAIRDDKLVLHYQPRININTGEVTGCEALIRWQHETLGLVQPDEFLPIAEMSELIHPLSDWVLRNAVEQVQRFIAQGHRIPVAINISPRNLTDTNLVDAIGVLLKQKNLDPKLLEVEITESALINHPKKAVNNLEQLDKLGISIAIDDFGTGFSSLNYLKQLPLDTLKIDRSFVSDMLTSEGDSLIVDSTINLAQNFSFTIVAEGVENLDTLDALAAKGCDQAQGYYIAKPMPETAFMDWLDNYLQETFPLAKTSSQ